MCRLFFVVGKDVDEVKYVTVELAKNSWLAGNDDGYFASVKLGKRVRTLRTMDYEQFEDFLIRNDYTKAFCHLRAASSGAVNIKNVHGWKMKGWRFAHNGWVLSFHKYVYYRYYGRQVVDFEVPVYGEGELMCDSYKFFSHLVSQVDLSDVDKKTLEKILEISREKSFRGTAFLVKRDFSKMIIISSEGFYLARYGSDVYVLSSKKDILTTRVRRKKKMKLWLFETTVTETVPVFAPEICKKLSAGVYYIDLVGGKTMYVEWPEEAEGVVVE